MALKRIFSIHTQSRTLIHFHSVSRKPLGPCFPSARLNSWRGTGTEDESTNRLKKGDVTDPQTEATKSGRKEKGEKDRADDKAESQAITERDQKGSTRKTEEEFPKAPKPVIGMTDERGEVSNNRIHIPASIFTEGGWLIFSFVSGAEGCLSMVHREHEESSEICLI
ncbi:hypothetical protein MferCBS31731_006788 [Microsporum ferrugineum]